MRKNLLFALVILSSLVLTGCFAPLTGPQAVIVRNPARGEYPLTVRFDANRSSGDIVEYLWVFGDRATATTSGPVVEHTYAERGEYTVFLTVVDRAGRTSEAETTVRVHSKLPVARFTISPASGVVGQPVTFDASGSDDPDGTVVEYRWNFGDGSWTSTSTPTVHYVYREAGLYTVELVVKDADGDLSDPHMRSVAVIRRGCC